jgi:hypothetical protein
MGRIRAKGGDGVILTGLVFYLRHLATAVVQVVSLAVHYP